MENKTIRIALSGILIYLISQKSYNILVELLLWLNVELRIDNPYFLLAVIIFINFLALLLLVGLYNQFLKKEHSSNKTVYSLLFITVFLSILFAVINRLYGQYLLYNNMQEFQQTYLIHLEWFIALDMLLPILGLSYFIWKLKSNNKKVANTI